MLGSTETTFYTIAVYFGSAGICRTRHTVPAALAADLTGFLASAFAVAAVLWDVTGGGALCAPPPALPARQMSPDS